MRKKLIVHIGLYKTGSTALQAFLAQNVRFLAQCGIAYPFIENPGSGDQAICIGNIWLELIRLRRESGNACSTDEMVRIFLFQALENALKESSAGTVLVSCEHLCSTAALDIIRSFSTDHDVRVIAFVRDPYDLAVSRWKQRVKAQAESRTFDIWLRDTETDGGTSLLGLTAAFARSGLDVSLLSYDFHRDRLIQSFLAELGLDAKPDDLGAYHGVTHNRSLSFEQATLAVMALRDRASSRLSAALLAEFLAGAIPFRDATIIEFDTRILEQEKDEIEFLNSRLPPNQKLRTEPRAGIKLRDVTFSAENVALTLSAAARWQEDVKPTQSVVAPAVSSPDLPADFDPDEYLLRNPDVARAGLPADYHYLNHGRWENRVYKALQGEPNPHPTAHRAVPIQGASVAASTAHSVHRGRGFANALRQMTLSRSGPRWLRSLAGMMPIVTPKDSRHGQADPDNLPPPVERYETRPKMSSAE